MVELCCSRVQRYVKMPLITRFGIISQFTGWPVHSVQAVTSTAVRHSCNKHSSETLITPLSSTEFISLDIKTIPGIAVTLHAFQFSSSALCRIRLDALFKISLKTTTKQTKNKKPL